MADVHDLEDYKEVWMSGRFICVACSHVWVGICHEDKQTKLECPDCHEMKGALIATVAELGAE